MRLVILGGGSLNTPAFFAALEEYDTLEGEICLVDESAEAVERMGRYVSRIVAARCLPVQVSWETDLALCGRGADFVLNMMRVGGLAAQEEDDRRLAVSGMVGHAATYPQAIRNLPATLRAANTIEQVAPNALWVNFSNPVTVLCEALALQTHLKVIGICYHAFGMKKDFAALLGVDEAAVRVIYYGLNHLGWVTDVLVYDISRMRELVSVIQRTQNKKYNHWYTQPELIPIDHAFCLYHKGDVLFDRQKGVRGSLEGAALRMGLPNRTLKRQYQRRLALRQAMLAGDISNLEEFQTQAPWYTSCIAPFLRACLSPNSQEFILTWQHDRVSSSFPDVTAESGVEFHRQQIRSLLGRELPEFAQEWVRQARSSERLLIRAVLEQSRQLAAMAWAIHPNVASMVHAERLAALYFPEDVQTA